MKLNGKNLSLNVSAICFGIGMAFGMMIILCLAIAIFSLITGIQFQNGRVFLIASYVFSLCLGGFYTALRGGIHIVNAILVSAIAVFSFAYLFHSGLLFDYSWEFIIAIIFPFIGWWRGKRKALV